MFKLNLFKDVNVSKFEIVDSLICNPILLGIMLCCLYIHINQTITLLVGGPLPCFFQRRKQREVEEYEPAECRQGEQIYQLFSSCMNETGRASA